MVLHWCLNWFIRSLLFLVASSNCIFLLLCLIVSARKLFVFFLSFFVFFFLLTWLISLSLTSYVIMMVICRYKNCVFIQLMCRFIWQAWFKSILLIISLFQGLPSLLLLTWEPSLRSWAFARSHLLTDFFPRTQTHSSTQKLWFFLSGVFVFSKTWSWISTLINLITSLMLHC